MAKTQEIKKKVIKTLKQKNKNVELDAFKPPAQSDDEDFDDNESLDSDQELQLAFARNELKPGLNVELLKPREFKNDPDTMKNKLKSIHLDMEWIERLDVTVSNSAVRKLDKKAEKDGTEEDEKEENETELANNDFKREAMFLRQAELAVAQSLPKLEALNVKTKRPEDYYAEMAKTDDHMKKVREFLLSKHAEMEKRDKVRKMRELKKMGKQIQTEVLKKKEEAKRKLNERVKKIRKGEKDSMDIEVDDEEDERDAKRKAKINGGDDKNGKIKKAGKKTQHKEKKYGFGGRKKRAKYNTADSYAEAYKNPAKKKTKRLGAGGGGKGKGAGAKKFVNKNKKK